MSRVRPDTLTADGRSVRPWQTRWFRWTCAAWSSLAQGRSAGCGESFLSARTRSRARGSMRSGPAQSPSRCSARCSPSCRSARHGTPRRSTVELEELAVRIRKELAETGWDHGPVTVRHHIAALGLAAPAASTLARIFTRRGMVTAQPQKRPETRPTGGSSSTMVHECWQLDAFAWQLADGSPAAVFQLLDDHSRFLIASHVASGETAAGAMAWWTKGIERFQVPCCCSATTGSRSTRTGSGNAPHWSQCSCPWAPDPSPASTATPRPRARTNASTPPCNAGSAPDPPPRPSRATGPRRGLRQDLQPPPAPPGAADANPGSRPDPRPVAIPPTPPDPQTARPTPDRTGPSTSLRHGKIQVLPQHDHARPPVRPRPRSAF